MLNKNKWVGFLYLLPALILLGILIIYPFFNALGLSFQSQLIYELKGKFVGFANYKEFLFDKDFWHSFYLSVVWTLSNVVGQVLFGLIISLMLNKAFHGRTLVRGLVLLPFFMPVVSIMLMWRWMLNDSYGMINYILISVGIIHKPVSWLGSAATAFPTIIAIATWRYIPFVIINILAKLQVIPLEMYEAAELDGANGWQKFRFVTFPEITDVLTVVIILRIIFMFKKVDEIMMLTNGGPGNATEVLPLYSYKNAFESMQLGKGAASSIILMVILSVFMAVYLHFAEKEEE